MLKEMIKVTIPKLGKEIIKIDSANLHPFYLNELLSKAEKAGPINGVLMMLNGNSNWMICVESNLEVKMIDSSFFFTDPFEGPKSKDYFKTLKPLQKEELIQLFIDFAKDIEKTIGEYDWEENKKA